MMKWTFLFILIIPFPSIFAQPVISSFTPISGSPGTNVVIHGTGFSNVPADNIVYFGPVKAIVTSSANDSIVTIVPIGATYDLISVVTNNLIALSAKKFLVAIGNGHTIAASDFASPLNYNSGNYPFTLAVADLDGDGKTDYVTGNYGDKKISFFRNTFNHDFLFVGMKIDSATPGNVSEIVAGDLDADGKLDIVTLSTLGNTCTISAFINNSTTGHISFNARQDFSSATTPAGVQLGDIDGDGKLDIVGLTPGYDSTFSVLRNTSTAGNLSFAPPVIFPAGWIPGYVKIADLDTDGKPDIIITTMMSSVNNGAVSIIRNTSTPGSVSFAPKLSFNLDHERPAEIEVGDLNNDNKPDIVTGSIDSTVSILINTSTGSVFSFDRQNIYLCTSPHYVGVHDIDGDSKPDIAFAGSEMSIYILQNTSDAGITSFAAPVLTPMTGSCTQFKFPDIDNDGRNDIAVGSFTNLYLIRNMNPVPISICASGNLMIAPNLTGSPYRWQADMGSGFANISDNSNFSGTANDTLLLTNIPSSWYGYKLRCGYYGYPIYSDVYSLKFENSWTGNTSNAWEDPSNWSCGVLPDANTDVIINAGNIVISSDVTIRSLQINAGVNMVVSSGYTLTILH